MPLNPNLQKRGIVDLNIFYSDEMDWAGIVFTVNTKFI